MILLSRLSGEVFYLNPNLIETIEETPDTVIKLTNDKKYVVKEKADVVVKRIIEYNRKIFQEKSRWE
ncbi:MAG: flagellar FlbD family protein [Leptospiraceae bacterium]|nr:flagellar FlbD family protein [Leptospiraceae bacterium]MDW8306854.1 flagellar FlbD family protein [Leptospiraceae bacterium]